MITRELPPPLPLSRRAGSCRRATPFARDRELTFAPTTLGADRDRPRRPARSADHPARRQRRAGSTVDRRRAGPVDRRQPDPRDCWSASAATCPHLGQVLLGPIAVPPHHRPVGVQEHDPVDPELGQLLDDPLGPVALRDRAHDRQWDPTGRSTVRTSPSGSSTPSTGRGRPATTRAVGDRDGLAITNRGAPGTDGARHRIVERSATDRSTSSTSDVGARRAERPRGRPGSRERRLDLREQTRRSTRRPLRRVPRRTSAAGRARPT